MNKKRVLSAAWAIPTLLVANVLSGCDQVMEKIMPAPAPEPKPPKLVMPKTEVFDPTNYVVRGDTIPGKFRVVDVPAGNMVTVQSVVDGKDAAGAPTVTYGTSETMHLAGIETVPVGKPGYAETLATIHSWVDTHNDLEIDVDPKFPWDLSNKRVIQLYFKPVQGIYKDKVLNLNRMMVRSGYAVVDLNSASSVDLQKWLYDEVYARGHTADGTGNGKPQPLGLWGKGIIIGDRPAPGIFAPKPPKGAIAKPTPAAAAPATGTPATAAPATNPGLPGAGMQPPGSPVGGTPPVGAPPMSPPLPAAKP